MTAFRDTSDPDVKVGCVIMFIFNVVFEVFYYTES